MKLKESEDEEEIEEETEEAEEAEAEEAEAEEAEPVVAAETDNVGDASVEINVEDLITQLEVQGVTTRAGKETAAKRRLEDLMEQKRSKRDLEDFEDYDI